MRVDRRRIVSVVGMTITTGLVGCSTTDSSTPERESPTPTETSTTGTENPSSRELAIISQADSSVTFDQQLVQQSNESTVYEETHTYDSGERKLLMEPFEPDETYEFKMSTPDGDSVYERNLYPHVRRLEVTIQSATTVEQTGITEV